MKLRALVLLFLGCAVACGGSISPNGDPGGRTNDTSSRGGTPGAALPTAHACSAVGTAPKKIVDLTGKSARLLVPDGDTLWFGAYDGANPKLADVFHVPTSGGTPTAEPIPGDRSEKFAILGREIAFVRLAAAGTPSRPQTLASLVLRDRDTGAERTVVAPSSAQYIDVRSTSAGLMWATYGSSDGNDGISWLDGSTATQVAARRYAPGSVVTDGSEVFYVQSEAGGRDLEAAAVRGGARRKITAFSTSIRESFRVVGASETEVYVARTVPIGHGSFDTGEILAIRKDGSSTRTVVTIPEFGGDAILDSHYVTWTATLYGETISRVPRAGGFVETITATGSVSQIAVDACNLYWSVDEPAGIYARSLLP